ncbi:KamA family radical SAM protein [Spirochaeta cellobiosiphila]|uniref:KamA family radical SAM protein n=1 Tax=Spirochaeta cellobiosiphila TaxID=504483 RepID=UPI000421D81A|nr:KamA family radical SAM protein [Spirochaeta cellobiosiphila]
MDYSRINKILDEKFELSSDEEQFFKEAHQNPHLPVGVSPYYMELAKKDPSDPIRKQFVPSVKELNFLSYESSDPLMEEKHHPLPRFIHRYPSRAIILTTDQCPTYCRHCFRRSFLGQSQGMITRYQTDQIAMYLASHKEVKEILITGGDPLMLSDPLLDYLLLKVKERRQDIVFRISTRMPVVLPSRVTARLVKILKKYSPLWFTVQFNHPRELTQESRDSIKLLIDSGIPIINQAVLLKGVNDNFVTLRDLYRGLVSCGIAAGYLLQPDLAIGTSHFRVSLDKGVGLTKALRKEMSALSVPTYAVDMPDGGGRIPLTGDWEISGRWYILHDALGRAFPYPLED